MKTFFVGVLIGLLLVALLFIVHPGRAEAAPQFGYRWTAHNGWIVWADNDRYFPIRTKCRWWAGSYWHTSWLIYPGGFKWTTSDAGSWGNRKPQNLRCSYVRVW